jgi:two-component system chemotaxis response regulator CheY
VDDNASTREMVKVIIQRLGHEVVAEAEDAENALKSFSSLRPDVVLLDIILPGRSGLVVLDEIRRLDPAAKVIMVTAVDQDDVNEQLSRKGASAVIYKPFTYEDFEKAFKTAQR